MFRRHIAILGLAVVLAFAGTSCGDDDDSGPGESGTTTTIDAPTRPSDPGDETGSSEVEPTEPGATTDPDDPENPTPPTTPNDSPLNDLLTEPADVGDGFVPDATLGDGSFDTDLCEEVTLDATWDDEASQGLRRGTGEAATYYTESIMSFSDAETAEEFVEAVVDGHVECLPDTGVQPRPDIADEAVVLAIEDGDVTTLTALVRSGSRLAVLGTAVDSGDSSLLSDDLLEAVANRLS